MTKGDDMNASAGNAYLDPNGNPLIVVNSHSEPTGDSFAAEEERRRGMTVVYRRPGTVGGFFRCTPEFLARCAPFPAVAS